MAGTVERGWPVPDDTDRVSAGAAAIRALGNAIDQDVPRTRSGSVALTLAGSATAAIDVTGIDVGGPFDVVATARHSSGNFFAAIVSKDNNQFRVRVTHFQNTASSITVNVEWFVTARA